MSRLRYKPPHEITSPYIAQHRDNPVDWFEWGDEAFALARTTDRPVLLSVGYSACHWCHVMAHESFEDEATANYMNEHFVNVKVDREERPDVDKVYMDAVQALTGHGGWPMTVFMTPDGEPFHAGTYFPKEPHGHMPSFRQVLAAVVDAWDTKREQLEDQAGRLAGAVQAGIPPGDAQDATAAISTAIDSLVASFDADRGGFGGAPKFPQTPVLEFLLRAMVLVPDRRPHIEPILRKTLEAMRAGGIYDQIGGGFARYSVDADWLIPHFEKMLYDNALLARVYLHAGRVFDDPWLISTARETLDYLATEMRDARGGIHAAEDADSEGVEGKYYVWTLDEFQRIAGSEAGPIGDLYGVTAAGNFEGANNLNLAMSPQEVASKHGLSRDELIAAKRRVDAALLEQRETRVRPGRDDKVIAAWNGLALTAFAEAAVALAEPRYLDVAERIAEFITMELIRDDGRLMRSWRSGGTSGPGFCVDYAAVAVGLFALYQATSDEKWYEQAVSLTDAMVELFADENGFVSTGADQTDLIARPREFMDNPLPSPNSLAAEALLLRTGFTGQHSSSFDAIQRGASRLMERAPHAVTHLLSVLLVSQEMKEVAIVGEADDRRALESVLSEVYRPECIVAAGAPEGSAVPLLQNRGTAGASAAAHVCRQFVCDLPVTTADSLRQRLNR